MRKHWNIYAVLGILAGSMWFAGSVAAEETQKVTKAVAEESEEMCSELPLAEETEAIEPVEIENYTLNPEEDYEIDLDGDGEYETVFYRYYQIEEKLEADYAEEKCVLEIYVNNTLAFERTGDWYSYRWSLEQCPLENGTTCLLVRQWYESDDTKEQLLLSGEDIMCLEILGDVADKTEKYGESLKDILGNQRRYSGLKEVKENSVIVSWMVPTNIAGFVEIPVEYEITEEGLSRKGAPYLLDKEKIWMVTRELRLIEEPGSEKVIDTVEVEEQVYLTEIVRVNDRYYIQCEKENGEIGWIQDPEESIEDEFGRNIGYIRCEMTPASASGEQQYSISGGSQSPI